MLHDNHSLYLQACVISVNTEWCLPYREGTPPDQYFCKSKLSVWANTADQATESLNKCRQILTPYFENAHKDIAAQLAGKGIILFQ